MSLQKVVKRLHIRGCGPYCMYPDFGVFYQGDKNRQIMPSSSQPFGTQVNYNRECE